MSGMAQDFVPFVRSYSYEEFNGHNQVFDLEIDDRGVLYISNSTNHGVVTYDGESYRSIPTENASFVMSLCKDHKGRILVGGLGEFGYISANEYGKDEFVSLSNELDSALQFTNIWSITKTLDGVIFHSHEALFIWDYKTIEVVEAGAGFHTSFSLDQITYVNDDDKGLCVLDNNETHLINGGEQFKLKKSVYGIMPYKDGVHLITSYRSGLFRFNWEAYLHGHADEAIVPIITDMDSIFKTDFIYGCEKTETGNYCFLSKSNGVYITDPQFNLLYHLTDQNGLMLNTGLSLKAQGEDLWISSSAGFNRVYLGFDARRWKPEDELLREPKGITRFNGNKIFYGNNGIILGEGDDQEIIESYSATNSFIWRGKFMILTGIGLFAIDSSGASFKMCHAKMKDCCFINDSNMVFVGGDGAYQLNLIENQVDLPAVEIPEAHDVLLRIVKTNDKPFEAIAGSMTGTVYRFYEYEDSIHVQSYDENDGLPDGEMNVYDINGSAYLGTKNAIYKYNKNDKTFSKTTIHFDGHNKASAVFRVVENDDRLWFYGSEIVGDVLKSDFNDEVVINRRVKNVGKLMAMGKIQEMDFSDAQLNLYCLYGMLRVDEQFESPKINENIKPLIRSFQVGDSIFYWGNTINEDGGLVNSDLEPIELDYTRKTIRLEFAFPWLVFEDYSMYSYRLLGFEDEWSEWTESNYKEYTNLSEGEYTFELKARNAFGEESEVTEYVFTINPPWYRTWWAYTLYVVLFILIFWIGLRLNGARLKAKNEKLQAIVDDRTAELREKNQSIMDSIMYAKGLQDAILPEQKEIAQGFNNHLVYFRPRDIVSGDFYWYYKKGDLAFIAAADCTGHGVPGAFVSMTCHNVLNQVVIDQGLEDPGDILREANAGIVKIFRKEGAIAQANDGMDVAFCVLNTKTNEIKYAGAMNPMVVVKDNAYEIIKADRAGIGGGTPTDYQFETNSYQAEKGDWFYIYSDGYPDQFGGPKNKKFLSRRFYELLIEIHHKSSQEQLAVLEHNLQHWKGDNEQIDDVLVVGFQV